ncbi:hypothetical protein [Rhizobium sp. L43]|nr:hypothetical protein [Rhizobium sp. L43]
MIRFVKKSDPQPAAEDAGDNRLQKITRKQPAGVAAPRAAEDDDQLI